MMMLDKLFGSKIASYILLHLYHYGDIHARGLAREVDVSLSAVQNQLARFEDAGIVVSKKIGTTRIYTFNLKSPATKPVIEIVKIVHSSLSLGDKEKLFGARKRPRRAGKPVLGRKR